MKQFFILFLIIVSVNSFGQTRAVITGKVKHTDKFFVNIYEPVNDYFNMSFFDSSKENSVLVNGSDSIYKSLNLTFPTFIKIYFLDINKQPFSVSDILVCPGDSIHIEINTNFDSANSYKYSGNNAMGQKIFNEINFSPINKFIPAFNILDELPKNKNTIIQELDAAISKLMYPFDTLRKAKKITNDFYTYMRVCFRSLLYNEIINKFLSSSKKKETVSKIERDAIIESLFKKQNPNDSMYSGVYLYSLYTTSYFNYLSYKKYKLNSIDPLKKESKFFKISGKTFLIDSDFTEFIYYEDKKYQEDMWAQEIINSFIYAPGKHDKAIINQWDSIFPNSKWTKVILKQYENKYVQKNVGYSAILPITYIDSAKTINNISQLLAELPKDDAVFIDLWASWCGPCIAEFGANKMLDRYLIDNKISKLYISINDIADSSKWQSAINRYSLGGYHILANEDLIDDIKIKIYGVKKNEPIPIPRYVLIDKKGVIVVSNANRPSDFELLTSQIEYNLPK